MELHYAEIRKETKQQIAHLVAGHPRHRIITLSSDTPCRIPFLAFIGRVVCQDVILGLPSLAHPFSAVSEFEVTREK